MTFVKGEVSWKLFLPGWNAPKGDLKSDILLLGVSTWILSKADLTWNVSTSDWLLIYILSNVGVLY